MALNVRSATMVARANRRTTVKCNTRTAGCEYHFATRSTPRIICA
jgi:hypothetical protein